MTERPANKEIEDCWRASAWELSEHPCPVCGGLCVVNYTPGDCSRRPVCVNFGDCELASELVIGRGKA